MTATRKNQAGQALVFAVVALGILLIGFAGLGIDIGYLRYQKRLQQSAADSAAIAGASDLPFNHASAVAAAYAGSATGGFTDNSTADGTPCGTTAPTGCVTVTVNNPPLSGPHNGDAAYVETYVASTYPTFFMRVLGINSETVTARAVATNVSGGAGNGCLYTLGAPNATIQGVNIQGHAILNATTCGIVDNGNFDPTGGNLHVNAGTFGVAGACNGSGCGNASVTCSAQSAANCPAYGEPAGGNPLASLAPPCSPCSGGSAFSTNSNVVMNAGTYSSISIGPASVTFNPGTYIIDCSAGCNNSNPGLSVAGNSTLTSAPDGVTFYFTNGATVGMTGTPTIKLAAPSSGTYAGILFYQDPADTNGPSLGGNTNSFYSGVLYFPSSQVTFFGNSNGTSVGIVIADAMAFNGSPVVNMQGLAGITPPALLVKSAILVE